MSITRIDNDLPVSTKVTRLNDMILELNGLVQQGKFDINELNHLYDLVGSMRKFKRNIAVGSTVSTYTGWTHLSAYAGYSIWKYSPTSYMYNAANQVYMGNKALTNRGLASSESATTFDKVYLYNGDSGSGYVDNTTEAGTSGGTDFALNNTINDYVYFGAASTFGGIKIEFHTRGSNYTNVWQYWNGSAWTTLATTTDLLSDGTNNFQGDGSVSWTIPSTWAQTSVNSQTKYWIRTYSTTNPIRVARAYYIIPRSSVIGLLALSTTDILNGSWAWCSFGLAIYVTIKNTGVSTYEGNLFITSSSTAANLQNFLVYNNPFTADYQDSTYGGITFVNNSDASLISTDGMVILNATTRNVTVHLMSVRTIPGKEFIIKVSEKGSGKSIYASAASGETIDGAPTYVFAADFECIVVKSDGQRNWCIISKKP